MKTSNKVLLSSTIIVIPVVLWTILFYTQEGFMLGSMGVQMIVWLTIVLVQVYIAARVPWFWKLVPVAGVAVALALSVYSWVGAQLLGVF